MINARHSSFSLPPNSLQRNDLDPDLSLIKPKLDKPDPYLPNALNNALSQALKVDILPDVTDENAKQLLELAAIDPKEELLPPPVCLEVSHDNVNSTIGTLGNFSLTIGKAKSRKTFFLTIALAAAVKKDFVLNRFNGTLPENQSMVLFFDTEQAKWHVQKAVQRVLSLSGQPEPKNFRAYGLRKFKPSDRLKLIEKAIYDTPELGMVVIDGVRDLVTSINDEEQATMMASKLLKWSEERNIHIACVLHQNKGDNNARGHLGSELQNKAETVLAVTKSSENRDISIVTPEYCRDKEFEPFAFGIDADGLPYLEENWSTKHEGKVKKTSSPGEIPIEKHRQILRMAFKNTAKPINSVLVIQLKLALKTFGFSMGDNKVKEFKVWYENEGLIEQQGTRGTKSSYYILNEQV